MGNVAIIVGKPLPKSLGFLYLQKPTGRANSVDHFQTFNFFGEGGKLSAQDLSRKMEEHQTQYQRPLVIEASPLLLAEDITGWIERAGLGRHLSQARAIFFCSDMYTPNGRPVASFIAPRESASPLEIFIGSRLSNNNFRDGFDYFDPLLASLSWVQAVEQMQDERTLHFLLSFNSAVALNTLLGTSPIGREKRIYLEGELRKFCSSADSFFQLLGRETQTAGLEQLPEGIISQYTSLRDQVTAATSGIRSNRLTPAS